MQLFTKPIVIREDQLDKILKETKEKSNISKSIEHFWKEQKDLNHLYLMRVHMNWEMK